MLVSSPYETQAGCVGNVIAPSSEPIKQRLQCGHPSERRRYGPAQRQSKKQYDGGHDEAESASMKDVGYGLRDQKWLVTTKQQQVTDADGQSVQILQERQAEQ